MDDSLRTPLLLSTIDDMDEEEEEEKEGEEMEKEGEEKKNNGRDEERRGKMLTMHAASMFLKKKKSTQHLIKGSGGSSKNLFQSLNSETLAHSHSSSSISISTTTNNVVATGDHLYARTLTQKRNELCTQVGLANAMDGTVTTGSGGRFSIGHRLYPLFRYHHDGTEREPPKKGME